MCVVRVLGIYSQQISSIQSNITNYAHHTIIYIRPPKPISLHLEQSKIVLFSAEKQCDVKHTQRTMFYSFAPDLSV